MTECVEFRLNKTIISTPLEQHDHWNPKRVAPATLLGFQCLIWRRRLDLGSLPDFIAYKQALEQKTKSGVLIGECVSVCVCVCVGFIAEPIPTTY